LGFWDVGDLQPRFNIAVGEQTGTNHFLLSDNRGQPGTDPCACLLGRHLTATKPGLYCLGFRLKDTSTNGPAGGPIHSPSDLYCIYLQAGLTINTTAFQGPALAASFGGEPGKSFYLERASALAPGALWETVAGPLQGANRLQTLNDPAPGGLRSFYRLRASVP
jgi:hypothetical protein